MRHHDSYTELNRSAEQSILKSPHFTKVPSSKEKLSPLGTTTDNYKVSSFIAPKTSVEMEKVLYSTLREHTKDYENATAIKNIDIDEKEDKTRWE